MIGLGTAINIGLIIAGGLCGLAFGRFMKENLKQTLMVVSGIIVLLLGMSGAMQYMLVIVNGTLQTTGPMLMIISMVVGAIIGEVIDLNRWMALFCLNYSIILQAFSLTSLLKVMKLVGSGLSLR